MFAKTLAKHLKILKSLFQQKLAGIFRVIFSFFRISLKRFFYFQKANYVELFEIFCKHFWYNFHVLPKTPMEGERTS